MVTKYKQILASVVVVLLAALTVSITAPNDTAHAQACTTEQLASGMQTKTDSSTDPPRESCVTGSGQSGNGGETPEDAGTTCAIEKVGWFLCPIIEASGKIGDTAFQFLSTTFLATEPELISNSPSGTKQAWELARNLANIMFIVAFLIIIYSQVTGAGITNYGIKKMLPRLIVAAIAVNASYYICQAVVDITNVMGYEIENFMMDAARGITANSAMPVGGSGIFGENNPGTLETIISGVLGVAGVVWFLLPFIFVGVGTIVITCIILLIILLMRKAFIVLLIVAAPVAFVLYLLPNTERYFQKWLNMFWRLLLVFPIVGMLIGGGQLASAIVLVSGSSSNVYKSGDKCITLPVRSTDPITGKVNYAPATTGTCKENGQSVSWLLGLVAATIAVAPLLAVFAVLKGALSAAGAIGGKIAGAVETYTKKGGEWGTKNTAIGRGMAARQAIKQNYKDQKFAKRMSATGKNRSAYDRYTQVAARGITGNIGRASIAPGSMQAQNSKLSANFAGAAAKIEEQEMSEKQAALNRATGGDMDEIQKSLTEAVQRGDEIGARAAQNLLFGMGGAGVDAFVKGMNKAGTGATEDIIKSLQQNTRLHHGNINQHLQVLAIGQMIVVRQAELLARQWRTHKHTATSRPSNLPVKAETLLQP